MLLALNSLLFNSTVRIDIVVDITGESITSSAGNATVSADANIYAVGAGITSSTGNANISSSTIVDITGESITSSAGNATVSADANIYAVGAGITSSYGEVLAFEKFKFSKYIKTERENLSFGISKKEIKFNATNRTQIKFEKDEKQLNFDIIIKQLKFERV